MQRGNIGVKIKVVPYTSVRRGVPVREDTYPEPSACEVGWPVPFLATFISPLLQIGTHLGRNMVGIYPLINEERIA